MPTIIHLITAIVFVALAMFPSFWLAWLAVGMLGTYLYTLHEDICLGASPSTATPVVLITGAMVAAGFSLMGLGYFLMAVSAVLMTLALRHLLPRYFPAESSLDLQQ